MWKRDAKDEKNVRTSSVQMPFGGREASNVEISIDEPNGLDCKSNEVVSSARLLLRSQIIW
jgi:hypothetical protein